VVCLSILNISLCLDPEWRSRAILIPHMATDKLSYQLYAANVLNVEADDPPPPSGYLVCEPPVEA